MNLFIFYAEVQLIFVFGTKIRQKNENKRKTVKER